MRSSRATGISGAAADYHELRETPMEMAISVDGVLARRGVAVRN